MPRDIICLRCDDTFASYESANDQMTGTSWPARSRYHRLFSFPTRFNRLGRRTAKVSGVFFFQWIRACGLDLAASATAHVKTRLPRFWRAPARIAALIGLLGFAGSASLSLLAGIPEPKFHDEFSYLLAADTFARGRLTNATHPMWVHFETFHIIHQPTYMSKYPPAQGMVLALGERITGHPIFGVWLSFGLMCAAITWMLYSWTSPRWAILGGFFALIHPVLGVAGYWAQSYWGGAVAATGGALLFGGVKRLVHRGRMGDSLLTAAGLAILANSRPFEGFLVSLPVGIFLTVHLANRRGPALWLCMRRVVMPLVLFLTLTLMGMGYYNLHVTGNAFKMPYQLHEETYAMVPLFLWQTLPPEPEYRHAVIRDVHATYFRPFYTSKQSLPGFLLEGLYPLLEMEFRMFNIFLIPILLAFPLLLSWTLRNRWARLGVWTQWVLILGLLTEPFKYMHYAAPVVALNYYFVQRAFQFTQRRNKKVAAFALRLTITLALAAFFVSLYHHSQTSNAANWQNQRAQIVRQLGRAEGQHLVIVSYGAKHSYHDEWVYNDADLDAARVIFARAMNKAQDCELIKYFKNHHIWSLNLDGDGVLPVVKPYPANFCR